MKATLSTKEGAVLSIWTNSQINQLVVDGDGTTAITLSGSLINLQKALSNVDYTPPQDFSGIDVVRLAVDGDEECGSAHTASLTIPIIVTDVNDAPYLDGFGTTGNISIRDTVPYYFNFTIVDVDAQNFPMPIYTQFSVTGGTLRFGPKVGGLYDVVASRDPDTNGVPVTDVWEINDWSPTNVNMSAPVRNLNAYAMPAMVFIPDKEFYGRYTLTAKLNDNGRHGLGPTPSEFSPADWPDGVATYGALPASVLHPTVASYPYPLLSEQLTESFADPGDVGTFLGAEFTLTDAKIVRRACVRYHAGDPAVPAEALKPMPNTMIVGVGKFPGANDNSGEFHKVRTTTLDNEALPAVGNNPGEYYNLCFSLRGLTSTDNPTDPNDEYDGVYVPAGCVVDFRFSYRDPTTGASAPGLGTMFTYKLRNGQAEYTSIGHGFANNHEMYLDTNRQFAPLSTEIWTTYRTCKFFASPAGLGGVDGEGYCQAQLEVVLPVYFEAYGNDDLPAQETVQTIYIDVDSVQDPPHIDPLTSGELVTDEDTPLMLPLRVYDEDAPLLWSQLQQAMLTATVQLDQGGTMAFQVTTVNGRERPSIAYDSATNTYTMTDSYELVQLALNVTWYTPAADFNGVEVITLTVNDHGSSQREQIDKVQTVTRTFSVTVAGVEDAARLVGAGDSRKWFIHRGDLVHLDTLSLTDIDTAGATTAYEVNITAHHGYLGFDPTLGPTFSPALTGQHISMRGVITALTDTLATLTWNHTGCAAGSPESSDSVQCPQFRVDDMRDFEENIEVRVVQLDPAGQWASEPDDFYITIAAVADYYKTCADFVAAHTDHCGCYYQTVQNNRGDMRPLPWMYVPMDFRMDRFLRHTAGEEQGFTTGCCSTFSTLERLRLFNTNNSVGSCQTAWLGTDNRFAERDYNQVVV